MADSEEPRPDWPLGPYLRAAREAKGLSFEDAARISGVSHQTIRNLERGYAIKNGVPEPVGTKKTTVEQLATALGADVETALRFIGITSEDPLALARRTSAPLLAYVTDEELLGELMRRLAARGPTT